MLDSIMVINNASLPLFSYDRFAPKNELVTEDEMLQSSFFSAIINFSAQLKADELKYIAFDKRSFVLRKQSDVTVIFSKYSQINEVDLPALEETIKQTANYLVKMLEQEGLLKDNPLLKEDSLRKILENFSKYLLDNGIIIDANYDFDPLYTQRKYRKFIFKSMGYEPGKCNIGPLERQKRLAVGMAGFIVTLLTLWLMITFGVQKELRLLLFFPLMWSFIGFYQYFFRFCVANGLAKKAVMR